MRTIFALPFKSNVLKEEGNGIGSLNMQSIINGNDVVITGNGLIIRCNHDFYGDKEMITKRNGLITERNDLITERNDLITAHNGLIIGNNGLITGNKGLLTGLKKRLIVEFEHFIEHYGTNMEMLLNNMINIKRNNIY